MEEQIMLEAQAVLLDAELVTDKGRYLFRQRIPEVEYNGALRVHGCAFFRYLDAHTLELVYDMRSEIDNWGKGNDRQLNPASFFATATASGDTGSSAAGGD